MLTFYENAFSPFARKVQLVLEHKGLPFEGIDGLIRANHGRLAGVNRRLEVPAIDHDGLVVVNSADIVAYLERVFPERPVYPKETRAWVSARAWERCADSVLDPILIDISYWTWAERPDTIPDGLLDAARTDLAPIYDALDGALEQRDWVCGDLSIADMALFPHLSATRMLGVPFDETRHANLLAWYKRCRSTQIFADDAARVKEYLRDPASLDVERVKIFWRGDRIEWILASGYHDWFVNEIRENRVLWPKIGVPAGQVPADAD